MIQNSNTIMEALSGLQHDMCATNQNDSIRITALWIDLIDFQNGIMSRLKIR